MMVFRGSDSGPRRRGCVSTDRLARNSKSVWSISLCQSAYNPHPGPVLSSARPPLWMPSVISLFQPIALQVEGGWLKAPETPVLTLG
jgi:hypothetical protein